MLTIFHMARMTRGQYQTVVVSHALSTLHLSSSLSFTTLRVREVSFLFSSHCTINIHIRLDQAKIAIRSLSSDQHQRQSEGLPLIHQKVKYDALVSYPSFQTEFCTIQRPQYSPDSRTLFVCLTFSPSRERQTSRRLPDNPRTSLDLDSTLCCVASLCTTSDCLCFFHTTDKLILARHSPSYCSSRHAIACG